MGFFFGGGIMDSNFFCLQKNECLNFIFLQCRRQEAKKQEFQTSCSSTNF